MNKGFSIFALSACLFSLRIFAQDITLVTPAQSEPFFQKVRTVLKAIISDNESDNEFDICVDPHQKTDFKVDRAQKKIYLNPSADLNQDDSVLKYQLALAYQNDSSKDWIKEYKKSLAAWKIIGGTTTGLLLLSAGLWGAYEHYKDQEPANEAIYGCAMLTTIMGGLSLTFAGTAALKGGCYIIKLGKPTPEKQAFRYMSDDELQQLLGKEFSGSPKKFNKLVAQELEYRTKLSNRQTHALAQRVAEAV